MPTTCRRHRADHRAAASRRFLTIETHANSFSTQLGEGARPPQGCSRRPAAKALSALVRFTPEPFSFFLPPQVGSPRSLSDFCICIQAAVLVGDRVALARAARAPYDPHTLTIGPACPSTWHRTRCVAKHKGARPQSQIASAVELLLAPRAWLLPEAIEEHPNSEALDTTHIGLPNSRAPCR